MMEAVNPRSSARLLLLARLLCHLQSYECKRGGHSRKTVLHTEDVADLYRTALPGDDGGTMHSHMILAVISRFWTLFCSPDECRPGARALNLCCSRYSRPASESLHSRGIEPHESIVQTVR